MKTIADILNRNECLEIVRKSLKLNSVDEVNLQKYEIESAPNDFVGFAGEYLYLKAEIYEKHTGRIKQLQYFIKSVPIGNTFHRDECERKGFFGKETRIYTDILPNIQKYAPTKLFPECYYTRSDIIVLEDLFAKSKDFFHLANEDYTIGHRKLVLQHHAKLHAASIAWEVKQNLNIDRKFKDVLFEIQLTMKNDWYVTGIKGVVFLAKMHPKFQTAAAQKFIHERLFAVLSCVEELTEPAKTLRNVLCHRDSWNSNIFFKNDHNGQPVDCRLVDFQLTRYNPPAMDVLFFLYTTTTTIPEQRVKIFEECLSHYYDSLDKALAHLQLSEHMISKEDFLKGIASCRLIILILCAICEPLMKLPKGLSNAIRDQEPAKFDYYMNTQRDELFLRAMSIDPGYANIILLPIEELLNYIFEHENNNFI